MVAESLISACVALGLSGVISSLFYRDRPFVTDQVIQLIKHASNASFPSDHAVGAFVIATAIWFFRRRDGSVWLAFAACIAFSRVWVGVHYPTDVAAGALLGIASAAAVHRVFVYWNPGNRLLQGGIAVYEKLESKVWARK
jgi:undecaprenyl-diphosphatase